MGTEKLKFKLELYATMWDQPPSVEIKLNDEVRFHDKITQKEDAAKVIEFESNLEEGIEHTLTLNRSNKTPKQTLVNAKGDITHDQLLHIKSISIDDIDIGGLVFTGVYTPIYPEPWFTQQKEAGIDHPVSFENVTSIGHNGKWVFTFGSPFYMWLLENLY